MKSFKKFYNLILVAIIILFPFVKSEASDKISVPIFVEWTYEGQKWANSPHKSNVVIKPQNGAPSPSVTSFDYAGDYIINFIQPELPRPGKYEYLIYQTNEDFEEAGQSVTYDKTVYRLIFYVESDQNGLTTVALAYDDKNFDLNNHKAGKEAKIRFVNDDPFIHKNNGDIVDPKDPFHPFNPQNPWYPENPTDPNNPYLPIEPNKPSDPTNPDRDKDNTPIYPSEPENPKNPDQPINPTDPAIPGRKPDYWPEYPKTPSGQPDNYPEESIKASNGSKKSGVEDKNLNTDQTKGIKDKLNGKNRNSNNNVRTGIESVANWFLILILAIIAYYLTYKLRKDNA